MGDAIENAEEVARLLREEGEPFEAMLHGAAARDLDLLEPRRLLGYGSARGGLADAAGI